MKSIHWATSSWTRESTCSGGAIFWHSNISHVRLTYATCLSLSPSPSPFCAPIDVSLDRFSIQLETQFKRPHCPGNNNTTITRKFQNDYYQNLIKSNK